MIQYVNKMLQCTIAFSFTKLRLKITNILKSYGFPISNNNVYIRCKRYVKMHISMIRFLILDKKGVTLNDLCNHQRFQKVCMNIQ